MKDVYNPDTEDLLEWLNSGYSKWPASDWDDYVMNGKNDVMVFNFANDLQCRERDFFVHALYYLIGDYWNSKNRSEKKRERIDRLISMVATDSHSDIQHWKDRSVKLLAGEMDFDPIFWFNYFIYQS
jgi:hypothetical protein